MEATNFQSQTLKKKKKKKKQKIFTAMYEYLANTFKLGNLIRGYMLAYIN